MKKCKNLQRISASALSVCLLASNSAFLNSVYAEDVNPVITQSGESANSELSLTQEVTQFNVTVPLALTVAVQADGTVVTATDAKIVNNSYAPVHVTGVKVEGINGYSLVPFDSEFYKKAVGTKEFGFQLNTENVNAEGGVSLEESNWPAIYGYESMALEYDAKLPTINSPIDAYLSMANITFTLDFWATKDLTAEEAAVNWTYTKADNGITITKYKGTEAEVEIPSLIEGQEVVAIGEEAFGGLTGANKTITKVNIPEGVKSIGNRAFYRCSALTEVNIPNSVTSIGNAAFRECALTEINIPASVTSIGTDAFQGCGFTEVTIPAGVKSIGNGTFWSCSSLTKVSLPEGLESIGNSVFKQCYALAEINIPDSVTSIGSDAFNGCRALTNITIPEHVASIGSGAFQDCAALTEITIPEGISSIKQSSFNGCTKLASVSIPDSCTSIDAYAFNDCTSLTSISIPAGCTYQSNSFPSTTIVTERSN